MRLSGIEGIKETSTFRNKDISIMTEGELFTHLIERQLEIKMQYQPSRKRRELLEQVKQLNSSTGVHGIHNIRSFDKPIQEIIAYAQHNPQAALGGGIGAINANAIKRACNNRIPAPELAVPLFKRLQFKLQTSSQTLFNKQTLYLNKIKEYHNEKLGRQGFLDACFNADMKKAIIENYFEDSGSALMYKVTADKELSDRALTKKQFQGLYGNSLKHVTGISDTNLNQFIVNGIAKDFRGRDSVEVIQVLKGESEGIGVVITTATIITIAKVIAIIATAAATVVTAIESAKKTDDWSTMEHNLPVLNTVTPSDSDFSGGEGNGNENENNNSLILPAVAAGGLGLAYAFGLFD